MSKPYSSSRHVFPNIFGVTEEIVLLILSRSYTVILNLGSIPGPLDTPNEKFSEVMREPVDCSVPLNPSV
jgi:hypothetical protein